MVLIHNLIIPTKRAFRGPFCLEIQKKLLVNHIKSTNSLFRLRGYFVTAPFLVNQASIGLAYFFLYE